MKTFSVFIISAAKYLIVLFNLSKTFALTRFLYRNADLLTTGRNSLYLLCIYISKDDMGQTAASEVLVGIRGRSRKSSLSDPEFN